jgi:hypothetical protein
MKAHGVAAFLAPEGLPKSNGSLELVVRLDEGVMGPKKVIRGCCRHRHDGTPFWNGLTPCPGVVGASHSSPRRRRDTCARKKLLLKRFCKLLPTAKSWICGDILATWATARGDTPLLDAQRENPEPSEMIRGFEECEEGGLEPPWLLTASTSSPPIGPNLV